MLDPKISELLIEQVRREFQSSYIYLDMANYYYDNSLNGFGNWFDIQTKEEYAHAMLIVQYLRNNGQFITLGTISSPNAQYKSFKEPLDAALEHEQFITGSINNIYAEAHAQKDYRTMQFLDWFVKEQGEEEQAVDELIKRYELFAGDPRGLYLLDNELLQRIYTEPDLVL